MASTQMVGGGGSSPSAWSKKSGGEYSGASSLAKQKDVRRQNIVAAVSVADVLRTSLGPRGMDKMIQDAKEGVVITNDGATILSKMSVLHPTAKMLVEVSRAQDVEAGDGTTSVVILCGAFLRAAESLIDRGIHPQAISTAYLKAAKKSDEILKAMSTPIVLSDEATLLHAASTSLNSKVVSGSAPQLAPVAVKAVLKIAAAADSPTNVDLNDIAVVKKIGGTVDDTEVVEGLVFTDQKIKKGGGGKTFVKDAKIGLIQFCLSSPKTDIENNITIKDYNAMDRLLREERLHVAKMIKKIAESGCNVLLIQKSILRDALTDLSIDYLAKAKIMCIPDIEREHVEFICKTVGCEPVASLDAFDASKLGKAAVVAEESAGGDGGKIVKITGCQAEGTVSILLRASNQLTLDEADRSLHDALCVVRALVKEPAILPGGGAPEMEVSQKLAEWSRTLSGVDAPCVRAFADALEVIPFTLAENAGLSPIEVVTSLRNKHASGKSTWGVNVRRQEAADVVEGDNVIQPLLVSQSAIKLAAETVMMILKIDDVVFSR